MARQLGLPLFINEENPGATSTLERVNNNPTEAVAVDDASDVARPDTTDDTKNPPHQALTRPAPS